MTLSKVSLPYAAIRRTSPRCKIARIAKIAFPKSSYNTGDLGKSSNSALLE